MPADLKLVKDGQAEIPPESMALAEDAAEAIRAAVKAGDGFWLLIGGDDPEVKYVGDDLYLSALAEEAARRIKMMALGLE